MLELTDLGREDAVVLLAGFEWKPIADDDWVLCGKRAGGCKSRTNDRKNVIFLAAGLALKVKF